MSRNNGKHFKEPIDFSVQPTSEKEAKKKKRNKIISNLMIIVGVVLLSISAYMWGKAQLDYYKQDKINEELEQYVEVSDDSNKAPVVDWEGLKKINSDVVGWIYIPGTVINYPVYQGKNNDTYLRNAADGSYSVGGQIFLDEDNIAPGMLDQQTIIYGHHLKNGSMFKRVADMKNQELFDSIHTVWYVTEKNQYELEPLFLYHTTPDDDHVRIFAFSDDDSLHTYLRGRLKKAQAKASNVEKLIDKSSQVLTLSTCNYVEGAGRSELVCVPKA